jgi:hypothetical protein
MGFRESLNQRPVLAAVLTVGLFVIAGTVLMVWGRGRTPPTRVDRVYYSSDEGRSYFADSVDRVYPFDHNGKPAYRAYVYQCGDGKPFVSYVARYKDEAAARLNELKGKQGDPVAAEEIAQLNSGIEVKRPGAAEWVPMLSDAGEAITRHPACVDGRTATPLNPAESEKTGVGLAAGDPPPVTDAPASATTTTAPSTLGE